MGCETQCLFERGFKLIEKMNGFKIDPYQFEKQNWELLLLKDLQPPTVFRPPFLPKNVFIQTNLDSEKF